jgi:predicted ArsR family transcriptional regulator
MPEARIMRVMRETRQRVIELLRIRDGRTVDELVRDLRLTRTAVTAQLAALQAEGLVARRGLKAGRRRPSVVYSLTPKADALFPKAYAGFAASLLEELKREGSGPLRTLLRRIGDRWIARDLPRVEGLRGTARLAKVREILAERGFLPALERTGTGYVLREHNCPVMDLAAQHEEVCEMVHRWLEALAGTPMVRVKCLRLGVPFSAYRIDRLPGWAAAG